MFAVEKSFLESMEYYSNAVEAWEDSGVRAVGFNMGSFFLLEISKYSSLGTPIAHFLALHFY